MRAECKLIVSDLLFGCGQRNCRSPAIESEGIRRYALAPSSFLDLTLFYKILPLFFPCLESHLLGKYFCIGSHAPTLRTRCSPRTHAGVDHFYTPAHSPQCIYVPTVWFRFGLGRIHISLSTLYGPHLLSRGRTKWLRPDAA